MDRDRFDQVNDNDSWFFDEVDLLEDGQEEENNLDTPSGDLGGPQSDNYTKQVQFIIEDFKASIWAFERLQELNRKKEEIDKMAESLKNEKIEAINKWHTKEVSPLDNSIEFLKSKLVEYYRNEKEKDPRFKLSTPYGKLTERKTKQWRYDVDKVIAYLKENNQDLIRVKEELDKVSLKKQYPNGVDPTTGEIIAGLDIEEVTSINFKIEG